MFSRILTVKRGSSMTDSKEQELGNFYDSNNKVTPVCGKYVNMSVTAVQHYGPSQLVLVPSRFVSLSQLLF